MWPDLRRYSALFSSAVLTGRDAEGYPFSVRCAPAFDDERQVVQVTPVAGAQIEPGRAGLLFHSHNEQLWDLKMFMAAGRVERDGAGFIFVPERLLGADAFKPAGAIGMIGATRRAAKQYLARRGLARPAIPWEEYKALYPGAKG